MRKILLMFSLVLAFTMLTSTMNAQKKPLDFSLTGGYSWLSGVVGGELQIENFGISGGWMPTTMPLSGNKVNSVGIAFNAYSGKPTDVSTFYISLGVASDGYRYEDWNSSSGYTTEETLPVTILMVGSKYRFKVLYSKLGVGYGWYDGGGVWTWEATLGIPLFRNY